METSLQFYRTKMFQSTATKFYKPDEVQHSALTGEDFICYIKQPRVKYGQHSNSIELFHTLWNLKTKRKEFAFTQSSYLTKEHERIPKPNRPLSALIKRSWRGLLQPHISLHCKTILLPLPHSFREKCAYFTFNPLLHISCIWFNNS